MLAGAALALGLPLARLAAGVVGRRSLARLALWWGLLAWAMLAGALSLMGPVRSPAAAWVSLLAGAAGVVMSVVVMRRAGRSLASGWPQPLRVTVTVACSVATAYLAAAALGPATNYDTGLYHLGAIRYAAEFGTVPGLANLYFGYGYANAQFPLAALLTNLPWAGEGWRFLNGFVFAIASTDLVLRLREARRSPGTFVAVPAMALAAVALVALSDYWVTSPTSDTPVFLLTLAFLAALVDAIAGRSLRVAAATMIPTAALLALLRPTTVLLTVAGFAVVGVVAWCEGRSITRPAVTAAITVAASVVLATARDRLLSGWLQYPLSIGQFDVPWAAADPTGNRLATLGTARDPANLWEAADGYGWLGVWASRLPSQWETWAFLTLTAAAVAVAWISRVGLRPRRLLLALAPPAVGVLVWLLLSPPSFRFGWGTVFGLPLVALGWALWRAGMLGRLPRLGALLAVGFAAPVLTVTAVSLLWRLDIDAMTVPLDVALGPLTWQVSITPVIDAPTTLVSTDGGLTLLVPTRSDQCWATYPLCTPQPDPGLSLIGEDLGQGLTRG